MKERTTARVRELLEIIEDESSSEMEKHSAAMQIVEAVAPDAMNGYIEWLKEPYDQSLLAEYGASSKEP